MKKLRFLVVLTCMLTLFASPASAADGKMGFVPLLTRIDPTLPVRVQTQQAFERLLPELLSAQNSGAILRFQPELSAGIVKITFAARTRPSMAGGMSVFETVQEALAQVPHSLPDNREGELLASSPMFFVEPTFSCVQAVGLNDGDRVVGGLRNPTGRVIGILETTADYSGQAWSCFNRNILPGYKVTFKVYDAVGVFQKTYSLRVPALGITALDNAKSIASGTGPAGKPFGVKWFHRNLNAGNTSLIVTKTGTFSSTGKWSKDFGTTKFRGADNFSLTVNYSSNFTLLRYMNVPYTYCALNDNYCALYGFPNQAVSLSITHGGTAYTFNGRHSLSGYFGVSVVDSVGYPVFLAAGDTISRAGSPSYALPNLTAVVNYTTGIFSGKAPRNKYLTLSAEKIYSYWVYISAWVHANASGNYSYAVPVAFDLKPAEALAVWVRSQDSVSGNISELLQLFGP